MGSGETGVNGLGGMSRRSGRASVASIALGLSFAVLLTIVPCQRLAEAAGEGEGSAGAEAHGGARVSQRRPRPLTKRRLAVSGTSLGEGARSKRARTEAGCREAERQLSRLGDVPTLLVRRGSRSHAEAVQCLMDVAQVVPERVAARMGSDAFQRLRSSRSAAVAAKLVDVVLGADWPEVPHDFLCPLSKEVMCRPVRDLEYGHRYDSDPLVEHFGGRISAPSPLNRRLRWRDSFVEDQAFAQTMSDWFESTETALLALYQSAVTFCRPSERVARVGDRLGQSIGPAGRWLRGELAELPEAYRGFDPELRAIRTSVRARSEAAAIIQCKVRDFLDRRALRRKRWVQDMSRTRERLMEDILERTLYAAVDGRSEIRGEHADSATDLIRELVDQLGAAEHDLGVPIEIAQPDHTGRFAVELGLAGHGAEAAGESLPGDATPLQRLEIRRRLSRTNEHWFVVAEGQPGRARWTVRLEAVKENWEGITVGLAEVD
jgi:hypothetical protein